MSLTIEIELTDTDLEHFRARFTQARETLDSVDSKQLVCNARALVERDLDADSPEFVRRRLIVLDRIVKMVEDDAWQLAADDRNRVLQALAYFVDPDDLIADDVPALGLLDDAIAIELAHRELKHEIEAYEEFSTYRNAEAQRRENRGQPTDITKDDWLADRRAVLHSRMHERRTQEARGWRYTTF